MSARHPVAAARVSTVVSRSRGADAHLLIRSAETSGAPRRSAVWLDRAGVPEGHPHIRKRCAKAFEGNSKGGGQQTRRFGGVDAGDVR
ncbi:hypothetical protein [Azospirillum doebereinerae]